jgi:hypothetical protein
VRAKIRGTMGYVNRASHASKAEREEKIERVRNSEREKLLCHAMSE